MVTQHPKSRSIKLLRQGKIKIGECFFVKIKSVFKEEERKASLPTSRGRGEQNQSAL